MISAQLLFPNPNGLIKGYDSLIRSALVTGLRSVLSKFHYTGNADSFAGTCSTRQGARNFMVSSNEESDINIMRTSAARATV